MADTRSRNYCLICGEYVEVDNRFSHCRNRHGLFPGVSVEQKDEPKYTILGIFATHDEFMKHISELCGRHFRSTRKM